MNIRSPRGPRPPPVADLRSHDITLRPAAPRDHEAVGALFESSYTILMRPDYDPALLTAALPAITRANPLLLDSGTFFVATAGDGGLVGCGGWTRERPGGGDVTPGLGHVRHFAVLPDLARRGIGRRIYLACERQARASGIERLECYSSITAQGFYASLGFEAVGELDIEVSRGVRLPVVRMERSLR